MRPGYYVLIAIAAFEFLISFSIGKADFSVYARVSSLLTTVIPAWALFPLIWAAGIVVVLTQRKVKQPLRAMRSMLFRNRAWLARCSLLAVMMVLVARSVTSYKTAIPELVVFWADPYLAAADRALFGTDTWRLTHALIGPFGTMVIDRVYALWFLVMTICSGWFCFTRNPKLQLRGLFSNLLCWGLLGNVTATLFASVGPCFYERFYHDTRFIPLMKLLHQANDEHRLMAVGGMNFLVESIGKDRFGAGISAMPSLHVSIAFLVFLASCTYANSRLLKIATGLFAATIMVGSVHLGWHYALDGIVGIAAVTLIWWGTGRFVDWLDARDRAAGQSVPVTALRATT